MNWSEMTVDRKERIVTKLYSQGYSRKNMASKLRVGERTIGRFLEAQGIHLDPVPPTLNDVSNSVARGWFLDHDSAGFRRFIIEQDMKFKARMKELYGFDEEEEEDDEDEDSVTFDPTPQETIEGKIIDEYKKSMQQAMSFIADAKSIFDANRNFMKVAHKGNLIIKEVALKHRVSPSAMKGEGRSKELVRARWEAIYRMREECGYSFPRIGQHLGGRDHTTILYGYRKYLKLLEDR